MIWTREFALEYMTAHPDSFYLRKLQHRYGMFQVKEWCSNGIENVCDIGAGVLGGALALFPKGKNRYVIDAIANDFRRIGKINKNIILLENDFANIDLPDNMFDVIFCWEVLDHALSNEHFFNGQQEIIRLLKPGGLLFFYIPLRDRIKRGHTILRTELEIIQGFKGLDLHWQIIEKDWAKYKRGFYGIFKKTNSMDL